MLAELFATPVPPFAGLNVPATLTAPVVAVLGVKPVDPNDIDETPEDAGAAQDAVVPFEVSTYVLVPIARRVALFVPFPIIKSPAVVIGDSALNALEAVV